MFATSAGRGGKKYNQIRSGSNNNENNNNQKKITNFFSSSSSSSSLIGKQTKTIIAETDSIEIPFHLKTGTSAGLSVIPNHMNEFTVEPDVGNSFDVNALRVVYEENQQTGENKPRTASVVVVGFVDAKTAGFVCPLYKKGVFQLVKAIRAPSRGENENENKKAILKITISSHYLKTFYEDLNEEERPPAVVLNEVKQASPNFQGFQKASVLWKGGKNEKNDVEYFKCVALVRGVLLAQKQSEPLPTAPPKQTHLNSFIVKVLPDKTNNNSEANTGRIVDYERVLLDRQFAMRIIHYLSLVDVIALGGSSKGFYCLLFKTLRFAKEQKIFCVFNNNNNNSSIDFPLQERLLACQINLNRKLQATENKWTIFEECFKLLNDNNNNSSNNELYQLLCNGMMFDNNPLSIMQSKKKHQGKQLSNQQEALLNVNLADFSMVKINAFAGSGKTSSLLYFINERPNLNFLYLCFNKSVQKEGEGKFPKQNTQVRTIHSLAWNLLVEENLTQRKWMPPPMMSGNQEVDEYYNVVKFLKQTDQAFYGDVEDKNNDDDGDDVQKLKEMQSLIREFSNFLNSSETTPPTEPVKRLWMAMSEWNKIPMTLQGMLKVLQISNLNLKKEKKIDVILLDECQDCNPCILAFVLNQVSFGLPVLLTGDTHQSIYSFLNSRNALEYVDQQQQNWQHPPVKQIKLNKSFRFGLPIASLATRILNCKKKPSSSPVVVIVGNPEINSSVTYDDVNETTRLLHWMMGKMMNTFKKAGTKICFISRTNMDLLFRLFECINKQQRGEDDNNREAAAMIKFGVVGGLSGLHVDDLMDVAWLLWKSVEGEEENQVNHHHHVIKSKFVGRFLSIGGFKSFENVIYKNGFSDWISICSRVKKLGHRAVLDMCEKIKRAENIVRVDKADVLFSTVHKAKGLEFEGVMISNDFPIWKSNYFLRRFRGEGEEDVGGGYDIEEYEEEVNLLYVACTRAIYCLNVPSVV